MSATGINFLDNLDLNSNQLLEAKLQVDSSAPSAAEGKIWFDSGSDKAFKYYNGTAWVDPAASGATYTLPAGPTNTNNQAKITLTGSNGTTDAVVFSCPATAGGLTLSSPNASEIRVLVNYLASANNVVNAATTSSSTGAGFILRTLGDSSEQLAVAKQKMSTLPISNWGQATATINMGGQRILSLGTPLNGADAATKAYVDASAVGSGALIFQGGYNASTNTPDLDANPSNAIKKGWVYVVTTGGNFFTEVVEVGDLLIAEQDAPTALADWVTVQNNIGIASTTVAGIASFPAAQFGVTQAGAVSIKATGVTANTYGSASIVPVLTINASGQITSATTQGIYSGSDFSSNVGAQVAARQKVLTSSSATTHTFTHNLGTYNVTCDLYDTSSKETVFAKVDRTSTNVVTATTSTAQSLTALIQKIGS